MAPFLGYSKQQAAAIRRTLSKAHLKPDADWPRLLAAITDKMYEATSQDITLKDMGLYRGEVTRLFKDLTDSLDTVKQAHMQLGEALQQHLDDQQFPDTLDAMREAVARATTRRSPYGPTPTTGAPKKYAIRQAVHHLLDLFEVVTGIPPKVSSSDDGYGGIFYPFAVAALTPVFPAQQLGSAILTAYREWRLATQKR